MKLEGLLVDLVPFGRAFHDKNYIWFNNAEANYWSRMGDISLVSRAQVDRERQEWDESSTPRTGVPLGIQTKDGTPLGYFGVNFLSYAHRTANLGAVIYDAQYWGGGYGTDALLLLIDYAFDWLDMRRVWLGTMSINARVMRQMEKVGFTLEARSRSMALVGGQWVDEMVYGMLREEWPGREAMVERLEIRAR